MNPSEEIPELVFSGAFESDEILACGESSFMTNGTREFGTSVDTRTWAKRQIGRQLRDYTVYIRYPTHMEEHRVRGDEVTESVHPVWSHEERGIDTLVPLLRGEWTGHLAYDRQDSAFEVAPVKGQQGYKVFLSDMPSIASLPGRTLSKLIADARAADLVRPQIYYDSVKGLVGGLNFGADGLVYNPDYPARHGDIVTCQGRVISVKNTEELRKARPAIEAVGYTVEEVASSDRSMRTAFNTLSARWATLHWHKDVMPLGPKARDREAQKVTA